MALRNELTSQAGAHEAREVELREELSSHQRDASENWAVQLLVWLHASSVSKLNEELVTCRARIAELEGELEEAAAVPVGSFVRVFSAWARSLVSRLVAEVTHAAIVWQRSPLAKRIRASPQRWRLRVATASSWRPGTSSSQLADRRDEELFQRVQAALPMPVPKMARQRRPSLWMRLTGRRRWA